MSRRALGAMAAIAILAVLAGCSPHPDPSPTPKESAMDATQAHDELDGVLVQAQQVIGGTWRSIDGGAEICRAPGDQPGAVFPFGRLGPGVPADQQSDIIGQVTSAWTAAGFAPVEVEPQDENGVAVRGLRYPASGNGVDGVYLSLTMTVNGSDLDAQSRCVPGDADKINEQRHG